MSNSTKTCTDCRFVNASMNSACVKCGLSLVSQDFDERLIVRYERENPEYRSQFLEELLTPTFWVALPLGLLFAVLGIASIGTPMMPLFLMLACFLAALPFMPGDPVGDYLQMRLEARDKVLPKEKS